LAGRLGSGDGERKTLLTRQIGFEPLPASVLFGLVFALVLLLIIIEPTLEEFQTTRCGTAFRIAKVDIPVGDLRKATRSPEVNPSGNQKRPVCAEGEPNRASSVL
jgi:hypothetical protein